VAGSLPSCSHEGGFLRTRRGRVSWSSDCAGAWSPPCFRLYASMRWQISLWPRPSLAKSEMHSFIHSLSPSSLRAHHEDLNNKNDWAPCAHSPGRGTGKLAVSTTLVSTEWERFWWAPDKAQLERFELSEKDSRRFQEEADLAVAGSDTWSIAQGNEKGLASAIGIIIPGPNTIWSHQKNLKSKIWKHQCFQVT
jgi:hypothetical protein